MTLPLPEPAPTTAPATTAGTPPLVAAPEPAGARAADAGARLVRHEGELDLACSVELLHATRVALRRRPATLAMDLSAVSFMDVAGLRAVISCRRMASARGTAFELVDASPQVRRLLDIVGLSGTFGL